MTVNKQKNAKLLKFNQNCLPVEDYKHFHLHVKKNQDTNNSPNTYIQHLFIGEMNSKHQQYMKISATFKFTLKTFINIFYFKTSKNKL